MNTARNTTAGSKKSAADLSEGHPVIWFLAARCRASIRIRSSLVVSLCGFFQMVGGLFRFHRQAEERLACVFVRLTYRRRQLLVVPQLNVRRLRHHIDHLLQDGVIGGE